MNFGEIIDALNRVRITNPEAQLAALKKGDLFVRHGIVADEEDVAKAILVLETAIAENSQ